MSEPADPSWEEYASSRLITPTVLLVLYGLLSLWTELALLAQSFWALFSGLEPLFRQELFASALVTVLAMAGLAVHGFGVATAATALVAASFLARRRSLRYARASTLAVVIAAVLLPIGDLVTLSCCALVPTVLFSAIGVFGGLLATLALLDDGVRHGFVDD